jgi:hypothetical protein
MSLLNKAHRVGVGLTKTAQMGLDQEIRAVLRANPRMTRWYAAATINPKFYGTLVIKCVDSPVP